MTSSAFRMRGVLLAAALAMQIAPVAAADFPSRPVKIITQGAAGSGPDVIARLVAAALGRAWGQQVLILNHPGGGGVVAARAAVAAEPDGHTLYIPTITSFVIMPEVQAKLSFDMMRDFVHVGMIAETPMLIGVSPALGVDSLPAFIALAKARPGQLFYAANNQGSLPHLAGELLRRRAGIDVAFVPYPGAAAALQDLMGGRIAMIVESAGALAGAIQGGAVVPLAVASSTRLPSLPAVPTVAETIPGFEAMGWFVLSGPAKMPPEAVRKVSRDLNQALDQPGLRQSLLDLGAVARPMTPEATRDFIEREEQAWRPLVRQLGLSVQ